MLNRNNFAIACLASKEESRYALNGILVEPGCTTVTDGHILLFATGDNTELADFPVIDGFEPTQDFQPFVLESKTALEVGKAIPKRQVRPVLEHAVISRTNGTARIAVTDLESPRTFVAPPAEVGKEFPDFRRVIPDPREAEATISFNPLLMASLLKQMATFCESNLPRVTLRIYSADEAMRIDAENRETGQKAIGAIMPMAQPKSAK